MEFGLVENAIMRNMVLEPITELPADAKTGNLYLYRKRVLICVEIANNFPVFVTLTNEMNYAQYAQDTPAMDWVFFHDFNVDRPIVQAYDENGNVINPSNIDTSVRGRVVLSFPSPRKGYVTAVAGVLFGTTALDVAKTKDFSNATEVEFMHGLGYNPIVQVVVDNTAYAPKTVQFPDTNTVRLTFETPKTGSVRVL